MWKSLRDITNRKRIRHLEHAFFLRFDGHSLIVHNGLGVQWLEALFKVGGGGSHFRVDARGLPAHHPTPVEWIIQQAILPLGLPLPLLAIVAPGSVSIRHLIRNHRVCDPADIPWIIDDMRERGRVHVSLTYFGHRLTAIPGLPVADNDFDMPLDAL